MPKRKGKIRMKVWGYGSPQSGDWYWDLILPNGFETGGNKRPYETRSDAKRGAKRVLEAFGVKNPEDHIEMERDE